MHRSAITLLGIGLGLLGAGCFDTASAQAVSLSVSPQTLTFNNVPAGATSAPQNVQVSANVATTVIVQVSPAATWLNVTPNGPLNVGTSSSTLAVTVNAQGLTQGTYQGFFTVSVSATNQVTVNVSVTVAGNSLLSANPSSLAFGAVQGSLTANPASSVVQIASSGAPINYNITGSIQSGGNWLLLGATQGTSGDAGFSVSVNPAGLAPGTYNGAINVSSTGSSDSVQITVTLTIVANVTLSVTPSSLPSFLYQIGGAIPAQKQLAVSAVGGSSPFTVAVSPAAPWLVVTPLSGSAGISPAVLTLDVTPTGLPAGVYTTNLTVTPQNGSPLPAVPITMLVSTNPLIQLSTSALSFGAAFFGAPPPDQQVTLTAVGTSNAVGFTFTSDSPWLTATTNQTVTPATMIVHVNQAGLDAKTYNGKIRIKPTNGDTYEEVVNVSLTVTTAATLSVSPPALFFSYQTSQTHPQPQTLRVDSAGQPVNITASTSTVNCGANWLAVALSANTTPSTVTVSVNTNGMSPGICSGSVGVTYNAGLGQTTVTVPVTVAVSGTAVLSVSLPSGFGNESAQVGSQPFFRSIPLTSTDPNVAVTFSANAVSVGGAWLLVGSGGTQTPQNLTVTFLPGSLTPGVYTGTVTIASPSLPGGTQLSIPISLTIFPDVNIAVSPVALTFTQAQGGPLPGGQEVTMTATPAGIGPVFIASVSPGTGGDWLQVTPSTGSANGGKVTATVKQNALPQGEYTAQINLTFQNAATPPKTIPVTLNITPPQTITTSAQSLTFAYQLQSTLPANKSLAVTSTGGPVDFTVGTTSANGWLTVNAASGTTPKELTVSVNPVGLAVGSYDGSITINAPSVLLTPLVIPVTLTVTVAATPLPTTVTNNASNVTGVIAPGELITIKGTFLGPQNPVLFSPAGNTVASTLGGVRVLFDNIPGIPIYVSAAQINVIVPFEISGRISTNMEVEYQGVKSLSIALRVEDTAPGIYTLDSTGIGQAAAVNQNGTFNGFSGNRALAPQGSVVVIYATGGGQTKTPGVTGSVSPLIANSLVAPVTATIGGLPATVEYAGAAPGLVAGVIQLNLRVPAGVTGPSLPVIITIGGRSSPTGPTLAVQ